MRTARVDRLKRADTFPIGIRTGAMGPLRWLRTRILRIPVEEVTFARRGFRVGDGTAQERLEQIGRVFLEGYHMALDHDLNALALRLNEIEVELRGFSYEGAALGLTLLDHLSLVRRNRLQTFLHGPGRTHVYMVHVGVGWAIARFPWWIEPCLMQLDPLLRWLAVDGLGFHEGYFHWPRAVERRTVPTHLTGYASRAFDQGLGRSIWFVDGADVERIPSTIAAFPLQRRADLWSGVGLACAYAGGADRDGMEALRRNAVAYFPHLAQGAAFAAKARQQAGNPACHTELACSVLCGISAAAAAVVTDAALEHLPSADGVPSYEVWRTRIRAHFTRQTVISG